MLSQVNCLQIYLLSSSNAKNTDGTARGNREGLYSFHFFTFRNAEIIKAHFQADYILPDWLSFKANMLNI